MKKRWYYLTDGSERLTPRLMSEQEFAQAQEKAQESDYWWVPAEEPKENEA